MSASMCWGCRGLIERIARQSSHANPVCQFHPAGRCGAHHGVARSLDPGPSRRAYHRGDRAGGGGGFCPYAAIGTVGRAAQAEPGAALAGILVVRGAAAVGSGGGCAGLGASLVRLGAAAGGDAPAGGAQDRATGGDADAGAATLAGGVDGGGGAGEGGGFIARWGADYRTRPDRKLAWQGVGDGEFYSAVPCAGLREIGRRAGGDFCRAGDERGNARGADARRVAGGDRSVREAEHSRGDGVFGTLRALYRQ